MGSAVQLGNKREHFGVDNKQIETTPACIWGIHAVAHIETPLLKFEVQSLEFTKRARKCTPFFCLEQLLIVVLSRDVQ